MQKKKKAAKKSAAKPVRQARLPEMDDEKITSIETAALDYAEARDERQAAGVVEKQKKDKLLAEMKAQDKTRYVRGDIFAEIVPEGEKLKVRIGHKKDEDDE